MRRKTTKLVVAAIAAAMLALPAAASAANSMGQDIYGISAGGALQNEDATTLARDLDAMQAVGARWVRVDINWAQIQSGGPSSYSWGPIDSVVQGATARGIKVLGVIVYTPSWARPSGSSASYGPDPAKYAAFADTAVRHYAAMGVHSYEVWNEPNIGSFWTSPNPAAYTRLLKAVYPAIKSADSSATVLSGGTAPAPTDGSSYSPVDFLRGIYANGGAGYFDAVSHHPYCFPASPGDTQGWSAWYQTYGTSPSVRSVMVANGDGAKKIWGTEYGAPTDGPSGAHVSEGAQADMITNAYATWASYDWAGPLFVYEGRDLGTSTSTRENFFGLLRHDFTQKPAYAAYQAASGGSPDTPPTDPPPPPTDTTTTVKGNGNHRGGGVLKGKVRAEASSGKRLASAANGRVKLSLYRRRHLVWRQAAPRRTVKLAHGQFDRHMRLFGRHHHPGVYRVQAHYLGSEAAKPSRSESHPFRVHN